LFTYSGGRVGTDGGTAAGGGGVRCTAGGNVLATCVAAGPREFEINSAASAADIRSMTGTWYRIVVTRSKIGALHKRSRNIATSVRFH
jgi:hypothetical protein